MDNASTRRGLPTSHLVFGDSATILGAIALTSEALRLIVRSGVTAGLGADSISELIDEAVGCIGGVMVGQIVDLRRPLEMETLGLMHLYQMKTAKLFALPVRLGSRLARASPETLDRLDRYAQCIGVAFQILDDILDYHATTAEAKKDTRKDSGRPNAVTVWGDSGAEQHVRQLLDEALGVLEPWGDRAWFLADLIGFLWAERWRGRDSDKVAHR
jgi:geranylgeranyl pyrophosphate synthase